ncbi:MAG TPA: glycosyltransferase family 39 protein [Tepidisphaeraceae bacterium]|nr:glycosyltransferase family 39 protein [Tepidisphaeraceae bacterium]
MHARAPQIGHPVSLCFRIPLLIAAALTLAISCWSIAYRLTRPYPLTPWESAFIEDAHRVTQSLPVYESLGTGHATHLYGPLGTYLLSGAFSLTGPNVFDGRVISLVAGMALTGVFILSFAERRNLFQCLVAAAMLISLHYRCRAYFTETRPDVIALLWAACSIVAAYQGWRSNRTWLYGCSAVMVVMAFLFKQTYAAAAIVPPLSVLLLRPSETRRHFLLSLLPLLALVVTLIILRTSFPLVWFYTMKVPSQFDISLERISNGFIAMLVYNPFFTAILFAVLVIPTFDLRNEPKAIWLIVASIIAGAVSIIAYGKRGGSYNSLLPVFAATNGFCILLLPRVLQWLDEPDRWRLACIIGSVMLTGLFCASAFGVPASKQAGFELASNSRYFKVAVNVAKQLPGLVLCPEEPTVTLFAKQQVEHSLAAELDAFGRPPKLPATVISYLQSADWIIRMQSEFEDLGPDDGSTMRALGFEYIHVVDLNGGYTLWRRTTSRYKPATIPMRQEKIEVVTQ